jgi:hypothetical protein
MLGLVKHQVAGFRQKVFRFAQTARWLNWVHDRAGRTVLRWQCPSPAAFAYGDDCCVMPL